MQPNLYQAQINQQLTSVFVYDIFPNNRKKRDNRMRRGNI